LKQAFQDFLESEENKNSLDSRLKEDLLALLDRTHVRIRSPHPSLIDLKDLSPKEIERILSLMSEIRDHPGRFNTTLQGKSGSTFLLKPSTRTKTSSERALINLGAQVIDLTAEASQYRHGEPLEHTVLALSGNTDFIFFRGFDHSEFESIARDSRVPMINGLTNRFHPLQALADTWTLLQIFGKRGLKGRKFLFMGDGKSNEISSLISILPQYGVSVRIVTPPDPRFAVNTRSLEEAKLRIQANHFEGTIDVTNSPAEEAQIADIIYVDSFRVMEATAEENANRVQYFIENGFQLNDLLLQRAKPSIKIMHAMPIHEGEEVSSREIVERPQSLMMQQADARVLSAMATLVWIHESTRSDLIQTTLSCGELLK